MGALFIDSARPQRPALLSCVALGLWTLLGCNSAEAPDAGPPSNPCVDPTHPLAVSLPSCRPTDSAFSEDRFSDEACVAFDDRDTRRDLTISDARAATILAPAEGQSITRATPFTFRWSAPVTARRAVPRRRAMTLGDELQRWTSLVPAAEAHCAPFSGLAYELWFRAGGRVVLRRQQSPTQWTPDANAWARLLRASGPVELTVETATFNDSQISVGGGPFVSASPRRFTLSP
jgi:hypothetical protein